jgi:hypothetical protein
MTGNASPISTRGADGGGNCTCMMSKSFCLYIECVAQIMPCQNLIGMYNLFVICGIVIGCMINLK